ncbi:MAG: nitroreductase family protein [Candidatus Muiribacterium halophilum]|uniref:Nitroreductase family protein n=1 Tax=Muiribacterium halophilum TaxID=2053465 RepID=A0A2N5ZGC8_MUIH1|nr:MAG: nitroreductase family protein [Candidatus Muirbacterium halophilum]
MFSRRRSIRKYMGKKVEDVKIKNILFAGMCAPSAGGNRPWIFHLVKNTEKLDMLSKAHPYASMVKSAPVCIVVSYDTQKIRYKDWFVQDLSACTENILLAIENEGLGGVWLGCYPRMERVEGIRRVLDIKERYIPFSMIPFGYKAESKEEYEKFDKEVVHYVE